MADSSGDESPAQSAFGGDDPPHKLPPQTTFRELKNTPHVFVGAEHLAMVPFKKRQTLALANPCPPAMPRPSETSTVQLEQQPSTPVATSDLDSPEHKPRRSQRQRDKAEALANADDGDDMQVEFLVPIIFSFMYRE